MTSLSDYVTRMAETQKDIYYITGESKSAVENSPFVERLSKENFEVIFMVEPIDEYCVAQLKEFNSHKLICVSKEGVNLASDNEEMHKALVSKYECLTSLIKEIIGDKIGKVVVSKRLVTSPCVIVTSEYSWSANMERLMKAQALNSNTMGMYMASSKTFEINAEDSILEELRKRSEIDTSDKTVKDLIILLFETSLISSGFSLNDPKSFANRIHRMVKLGLSISDEPEEVSTVNLNLVRQCSKMEEVD